jgi:hypothetical protein
VRPYDTEEAFLESELETVGKTSVILIGAHARPTGVILRFEVCLQNGNVVLRGEGRVLQHKEAAFRGQAGLSLRFTRLDPKSKAVVDRAGAIREARLSGSMPPHIAPTPPPAESSSGPVIAPAAPSSNPIGPADQAMEAPRDTSPPTNPPTRPPTRPPNASDAPVQMPIMSFVPLAIPSAPPNPNLTVQPDPMLAQILTGSATPPPPDAKTERPAPIPEEAKTRPGKRAELAALVEQAAPSSGTNVHSASTVAAPALPASEKVPDSDEKVPPPPPPVKEVKTSDAAVTKVADREALLARLRERRAGMSEEKKDDILRSR